VASLLAGRIEEALRFNPLALVVCALVAAGTLRWLIAVVTSKRLTLELTTGERALALLLSLLALAANWAYVIQSESFARPFAP